MIVAINPPCGLKKETKEAASRTPVLNEKSIPASTQDVATSVHSMSFASARRDLILKYFIPIRRCECRG